MIMYLVGPRASGKTSVGGQLAKALNIPFADTDLALAAARGMPIAEVVAQEGWEGFRAHECEALRNVSSPPRIVATGGGIVLDAANRRFMREHGTVLYLSAPATVLAARLEAQPDHNSRPSLTGKSIALEVEDILKERDHLYRECAHHVVDAARETETIVREIISLAGK
jgi:Shikimate kinase